MSRHGTSIAISSTGMVTAVGLDAASSCAAIRAGISGINSLDFIDANRDRIRGARVPLKKDFRGPTRLIEMMALATRDCLAQGAPEQLPVICCLPRISAEGPFAGIEEKLHERLSDRAGIRFEARHSSTVAAGRTSIGAALAEARRLIHEVGVPEVLVVAGDSLLTRSAIADFELQDRLLAGDNLNGFLPGEAASALLLSRPQADTVLCCDGIAVSHEQASIASGQPLRADGLAAAMRGALAEADLESGLVDVRLTDLSGEHYYFREAALALSRVVRVTDREMPLWHPAECIGETGAAIGPLLLGVALMATRKRYAPGPNFLLHLSEDAGSRVGLVLRGAVEQHG